MPFCTAFCLVPDLVVVCKNVLASHKRKIQHVFFGVNHCHQRAFCNVPLGVREILYAFGSEDS